MNRINKLQNARKTTNALTFLLLLLIFLSLSAGCGKVKSANQLYKQAKRDHGSCTIVSKQESADRTQVVLHDKLQDFDYTVSSSMQDISIDGTSFGSVPGDSDRFMSGLKEKVTANVKVELEKACSMDGVHYEVNADNSSKLLLVVFARNAKDAETAAVRCAELLQEQNINNRLDGLLLYTVGNESGDAHWGSVRLPDTTWRTPTDEAIDYYTEMARAQTDKNAQFLRMQKGTFADTGAELKRVVNMLGTEYPTESTSPVTFYYFEASDGTEYYLCDFNYYDEESRQFAWYTNYKNAGKK